MKKIFIIFALSTVLLTGCSFRGYDMIDTNYHFDYAFIKMPDDSIIEGEIKSWSDAEGEQLTITLKDGNRYLVSSYKCVLVERNKKR